MAKHLTVGLIQARPVFNDLPQSVEKAVALIEQAARENAELVAFGESWLAGYPAWLDCCPNAALWDYEPTKAVYAEMRRNSIVITGRETALLSAAARENRVTVVIGANERIETGAGNGTLYNALLTFDERGALVNHHRKLVPTFTERLVHGQGDGDGLKTVQTAAGRIGGLVCWEHWMPLARQTMHNAGEQVHVAVFPTVHENHQIASRHYALEGRCFVVAVGLIMQVNDLPVELSNTQPHENPASLVLRGGSCVIAPDGKFVVEPVFDREELIRAEIDLGQLDREKMTLDVSGHYHRPDIFEFRARKNRRA